MSYFQVCTAASGDFSDSSVRKSPRRSPGIALMGEEVFVLNLQSVDHKHGSKCKYKHEKPRERSNSSRSGRSSSRSSFHSSRSRRVHQGHPTGKTSPKYHVGSSRKVIAREETGAHSSVMDHHPPRQLHLVKKLDLTQQERSK